jgi:hypothetical protein
VPSRGARGSIDCGVRASGAVLEPPAFGAGRDDGAMILEASEELGGHLRIGKDARPCTEGEIGRDDDRGLL